MSQQIIYPAAIYVFYMGGLIVYNLVRRLRAVKQNQVSGSYFKAYDKKNEVPEELLILERHIDNQFQLPTIYLATCAMHVALGEVDLLTVSLAWIFVFLRFWHSYIHLGSNAVLKRAKVYGLGWFTIWALWIQLVWLVSF